MRTDKPIYTGSTEQSVARVEALAKLMDGAFVIPGTNIRMGLDGLIGFVPVAGDMVSGLISSYLIWEARQLGAPAWLIGRMIANTLLDTTIGAIPVVGDAFDIMFRANMKNMALLPGIWRRKALSAPRAGLSSRAKRSTSGEETGWPTISWDKIPDWLKSPYHMENELRSSARNG